MSTRKTVGHEAIEDGQSVIVIRRSERPMGGLVGFLFGTLLCLFFNQETTLLNMLSIICTATIIGYVFSKGPSTKEIQKHRVITITRKRNYAAVHYAVQDSRPIGMPR